MDNNKRKIIKKLRINTCNSFKAFIKQFQFKYASDIPQQLLTQLRRFNKISCQNIGEIKLISKNHQFSLQQINNTLSRQLQFINSSPLITFKIQSTTQILQKVQSGNKNQQKQKIQFQAQNQAKQVQILSYYDLFANIPQIQNQKEYDLYDMLLKDD